MFQKYCGVRYAIAGYFRSVLLSEFPTDVFFYFIHGSLQESCLYAAKLPTKFFLMFLASVYLGIQLFSARLIMFGMEVSKRNP